MDLKKAGIKVSFVRLQRDPENIDDPMAFQATVETPAGTFSSDWQVGVGHAKGYKQSRRYTIHEKQRFLRGIAAYKPVPEALICHILAFSDVLEMTFPDWAENMGDSADSISAKAGYETLQQQNIILRNAFSGDWDAMVQYAREQ